MFKGDLGSFQSAGALRTIPHQKLALWLYRRVSLSLRDFAGVVVWTPGSSNLSLSPFCLDSNRLMRMNVVGHCFTDALSPFLLSLFNCFSWQRSPLFFLFRVPVSFVSLFSRFQIDIPPPIPL